MALYVLAWECLSVYVCLGEGKAWGEVIGKVQKSKGSRNVQNGTFSGCIIIIFYQILDT